MRPVKNFLWFLLLLPFLFLNAGNAFANDDVAADDYKPEITARVARIDFLRGDAQIKRAGSSDWERVAPNLPIVEGDEITTGENARLEIQFDSRNYLRLAANSYLKITTLKDDGIAVSLTQGSLSARILEFDTAAGRYFEIDAPRTTVAVRQAGMYRVDAGDERSKTEVRVAVTDGGEARIYADDSGFTLRSGRSARIFLEGGNAGEWETADASRYADEFDGWSLERDTVIAKRLKNADYDRYYDRDIYGAEDLNDNGEWIHTKKYGYVWRPYASAIGSYANWSPYRYGSWRWVPPYGWTWVGDESWGWATYHHGRWVYIDRHWAWTPYGQRRSRRSWWHPALVVVSYVANNICWYPLPYGNNYYNYNSTYIDRRTTIINNIRTTVVVNPTPTPVPDVITGIGNPRVRRTQPPIGDIPVSGVVAVAASNFGVTNLGFSTVSTDVATRVLSQTPGETDNSRALPNYKDLKGRISKEIVVDNSGFEKINTQIKTGAGERKGGGSIDENLRQERIFGNRSPIEKRISPREIRENGENADTRETGAVKRQQRRTDMIREDGGNNGSGEPETREIRNGRIRSTGVKPQERNDGNNSGSDDSKSREKGEERRRTPPNRDAPPPQQSEERKERRQSPPQREERREERRQEPPQREQQRQQPPPPRSEPPQRTDQKSQPREEKPPAKVRETSVDPSDN